jgi:hypothetical protein
MTTLAGSHAHLAHSTGFATLHEMLHAALARCWMTLVRRSRDRRTVLLSRTTRRQRQPRA